MLIFNTIRLSGILSILLLLVCSSCTSKKKEYNKSGQSADVSVQTGKKTVIQDLCWSPNGRYIFFSAMKVKPDYSDYSPELWTIYRFDSKEQSTVMIVKSALNVAVSPSGEILAVAMNLVNKRSIYLVDKNGLYPRALVTGDAKNSAPTWSPDGRKISFVSTEHGTEEIFSVNINGSNRIRLTDSQGHKAYNPAWSPDGISIAYYLEKDDDMDQIHVMKADGTEDRNITADTLNNIFPGWIDNQTIIYGQGHKNGPTKVFQINRDGTNKKQILQLESMYARYSPDGTRIAYIDEKERMIKVISTAGHIISQISVPE